MKNLKKPLNNYARYTSIAMQMLVIIVLGVWGGVLLDKYIGIKFPVFTVLLSLGSVSLAIYVAVKDFLKKK
ncbi:MAG TPA: AtpZ/AtpI family protein [Bacteroidales bacterium]|jgi:F0F1-type ATP synthase assembly protein I|nr:AtpZ/AtpI family protein [Bacteroidales bacterium]HNZ42107.1 AtpZ/AtpI family protein [Bacteroidales bacterium]HOH83088.1 AtpZ/AtpI family protein [Bacteroidales bacterium]HPB24352.1 AtpZ/AtpI family protein [Bacteroidales bacterium]HPI29019.1 AtpZ/AtpI family protein [Bacteroidales bacterium]